MRINIRFLLALLSLLPALANAQSPAEYTGAQFRVMPLDAPIPGAYIISDKGRPRFLKLAPGFIAGPSARGTNGPLRFFKKDPTGTSTPIASAIIPAAIQHPLILLLETPAPQPDGSTLPCSALVLDESLRAFPLNSVRFINLSGETAAVSFAASKPQQIAPGNELTLPFAPPAPDDSYRPLHVALQSPGGTWRRVTSAEDNEVYLEAGIRLLVIIRSPSASHSASASGVTPRINPVTIIQDANTRHLLPPQN